MDKIKSQFHQVIVITPCCYLMQGLVSLIDEESLSLTLVHVSTPEEIARIPSPSGQRLVLMVNESDSPAEIAHQQAVVWRFERLVAMGAISHVPFLQLSSSLLLTVAGKHYSLSASCLADELSRCIEKVLTRPGEYLKAIGSICRLSRRQRSVLAQILSGKTVQDIADSLCVTTRSVFASRSLLMRKMGGCNRLGLMSLSELDMGICSDILRCDEEREDMLYH